MLSFDKSDSLNDESDDDGPDSRLSGTCTFPFRFEESIVHLGNSVSCVDKSVGNVRVVGYGVFVPIGIYSIGEVVALVLFVPIGVDSKGCQLIEICWRPKS